MNLYTDPLDSQKITHFPPIGGQLLEKSLFYHGPKIFNRILKEENIQINSPIHTFKCHLKKDLISKIETS